MRRVLLAIVSILSGSQFLCGQTTLHIFPAFVDGMSADGSFYKSTVMVTHSSDSGLASCALNLFGMAATFPGTIRSSTFDLSLLPGTALAEQSSGAQPLAMGYAILTCDKFVSANVLYSFYAANGVKLGETTAFATAFEANRWRIIADQREGSQLGISIANNTTQPRIYDLFFVSGGVERSGSLVVPALQTGSRFLSEIVTLPPGSAGLLTIRSRDFSNFSAIGFRFTGATFAAIPAN